MLCGCLFSVFFTDRLQNVCILFCLCPLWAAVGQQGGASQGTLKSFTKDQPLPNKVVAWHTIHGWKSSPLWVCGRWWPGVQTQTHSLVQLGDADKLRSGAFRLRPKYYFLHWLNDDLFQCNLCIKEIWSDTTCAKRKATAMAFRLVCVYLYGAGFDSF